MKLSNNNALFLWMDDIETQRVHGFIAPEPRNSAPGQERTFKFPNLFALFVPMNGDNKWAQRVRNMPFPTKTTQKKAYKWNMLTASPLKRRMIIISSS
jgi:hypothetical protein